MLHSTNPENTPYQVWFNFKTNILKYANRLIYNTKTEILALFLDKVYQKNFLL